MFRLNFHSLPIGESSSKGLEVWPCTRSTFTSGSISRRAMRPVRAGTLETLIIERRSFSLKFCAQGSLVAQKVNSGHKTDRYSTSALKTRTQTRGSLREIRRLFKQVLNHGYTWKLFQVVKHVSCSYIGIHNRTKSLAEVSLLRACFKLRDQEGLDLDPQSIFKHIAAKLCRSPFKTVACRDRQLGIHSCI